MRICLTYLSRYMLRTVAVSYPDSIISLIHYGNRGVISTLNLLVRGRDQIVSYRHYDSRFMHLKYVES